MITLHYYNQTIGGSNPSMDYDNGGIAVKQQN